MHEKPFKDITVKDITERADLNRGTFYLHYVDIYDLLSKIEDETLQAIEEMMLDYRCKINMPSCYELLDELKNKNDDEHNFNEEIYNFLY